MRVRGLKAHVTVQEYDHAYLVRGYGILWGITVDQARLALFEWLGRKKWTRICAMPYRPLYTVDFDKEPTGAVAFYFNIGDDEDGYKP